jgi:phosphoglycolate phosphatase
VKHGLIFDLDGTLVDSLAGIAASLNHALASSDLPGHSLEAVRGFIGNGLRILIQRGTPPSADESLIGVVEQAFKSDYDLTWHTGTFAYEGVFEMLDKLQDRGYPLAVLSNKLHPFTEVIVARLFPSIRFSAVLGQGPGIPHKPDPTGALQVSKALGCRPDHCWIIGDSTMDLETAQNAGMRSFAVSWGFHDRERLIRAGADSIADDPAALTDHFR